MKFPIEWCIDQIRKLSTSVGNFLSLSGGTLTGPLILSRDPVENLEAATKQYVQATVVSDKMEFFFNSPTDPWLMTHNKGRHPVSVRLLVKKPTSTELRQYNAQISDLDTNTTIANLGANLEGRGELIF